MLVKSDPKNVKAYDSPYCGSWEVPHSIVVRDFTGREEALARRRELRLRKPRYERLIVCSAQAGASEPRGDI